MLAKLNLSIQVKILGQLKKSTKLLICQISKRKNIHLSKLIIDQINNQSIELCIFQLNNLQIKFLHMTSKRILSNHYQFYHFSRRPTGEWPRAGRGRRLKVEGLQMALTLSASTLAETMFLIVD